MGQRSTPSLGSPFWSIGSPITFQRRPSVSSPTGTVIGPPRSTTSTPRDRPSVESIATARMRSSPQLVVDATDVVARSVEIHVHLLDDHALLAVDLLRVEFRVPEHVDEDVERDRPVLSRAADVVARVLLAREGVELAADSVDLTTDVAGSGPALR